MQMPAPVAVIVMIVATLVTAALIAGLIVRARTVSAGAAPAVPGPGRILAEHIADLVATHERDGTFRYVSPVLAGMLGEYPSILTGKQPRDFAHPDDAQALTGLWRRALASPNALASVTWRCRRHDGDYVWLESTARLTALDASELGAIVCVSRDVTERKQIEDALRDSENRFRTTLETVRLVAVSLDTQGRVTFCNDALCTLTGWSRAELLGENWFDRFVPAPAAAEAKTRFLDQIADGRIRPKLEYEIACRDGTRRMIEWDNSVLRTPGGDVLGAASLGADVTARRQEEAALKLLQSITLAISAATDLNAALALTLESLCSVTGWGYGEAWLPTTDGLHLERMTYYVAAGLDCSALVDAGTSKAFVQGEGLPGRAWKSKSVERFPAIATETLPRGSAAVSCGFESAVAVPVLSGSEVVAVLGFFMDHPRASDERHTQMVFVVGNQVGATIERRRAQKQYEAAILRARDEAEAASHAKSGFLSRMSHELRTPLNSVIGFANVLRKNKANRLTQDDLLLLDRITANGRHLLSLVNNVLDIAKVEAGRLTVTNGIVAVDELIRDVSEQLEGQRAPAVRLKVEVPEDMTPVETDGILLRQVLINLAGNALRFTQEGSVVLSADTDSNTGRPLRIHVKDTGIGIAAERQRAIFEPFEQAEPTTHLTYGGTGLGLSISKAICDALDFRLTVSSEQGSGSTFTVHMGPTGDTTASRDVSNSERAVPKSDTSNPVLQAPVTGETQRR
ncbi:MAG TPA: PAS domain S-box protein [Gemmatimonadaceae bacterium]|nr:PAS domain S-box protein [Gemmatimonadaceae bacterium]